LNTQAIYVGSFCNSITCIALPAREPERRKVGVDARVTVEGTAYEVDPQLAGEVVLLWWGLFDDALYIEYEGERFGP
jgi:hypothetical protein